MANDDRRSLLLRHRFDSGDQLKTHLHVVEGLSLLFFRDPALNLAAGAAVLLEVILASSEQARVVRASLVARVEGQGSWLAIPNSKFAREVHDRGFIERRGRRLGADRPVKVRCADGSDRLVTLLDLSIAGARLGGGLPRSIAPGDQLELRLLSTEVGQPPELGRASVVWAEDGEAGLLFDRAQSTCRVSVGRLFQTLQKQWEQARTIDHPAGCCAGKGLFDPPVPRVRTDGKNDASRAKQG
ncbi:MAG TPA: PilZ domain-containing protein [Myxococcales bacterium]